MNVSDLIKRIKTKSAGTLVFHDLEDSASQKSGPKCHEVDIPTGPGVEQLNSLLEILPPISIKWGPWIAGGAVRRILQQRVIDEEGDVDLFFSDAGEFLKFDRALSSYELVHSSGKAKTYMVNGLKVQIIKRRFYDDLKTLFADFDFSVCQVATDGKKIAYADEALQDIKDNRLRFANVGRISPLTVVGRMVKYVGHGFTPDPGLFRIIVESGLDMVSANNVFDIERPSANYDHDEKVEEIIDAKVFDSKALRKAAKRLGVELPA